MSCSEATATDGVAALPQAVRSALLDLYAPEVAALWLVGLNPRLADRRPIDLVETGKAEQLVGVIADEMSAGYA